MWKKKLVARRRIFRKSLRNTRLYSLFGDGVFHGRLWKADKQAVAGGLALGLFIAFTPTIPFQMLLATAGALILKVNLPVALAACWVTNPLTALPIYMAAWRLGRIVIGQESFISQAIDFFADKTGGGKFIRQSSVLWTGSLIFSTASALAGNILVRALWNVANRIAMGPHELRAKPVGKAAFKAMLPVAVILAGIVAQKAGWIDLKQLTEQVVANVDTVWLPWAIAAIMIVLYAFALNGSIFIVICGFIYPPLTATAISVVASVLGSWLAFLLALKTSGDYTAKRTDSKLLGALRKPPGFSMLLALRLLPGFPHAAINYSAGMLKAKTSAFLPSTTIGFAIKSFVYTSAVYDATHLGKEADIWSFSVLWPLFALVVLAAAGLLIEKRLARIRSGAQTNGETPDQTPACLGQSTPRGPIQ